MENAEKSAVVGIIIALIVATLVAFAGSQGGQEFAGIPIMMICFALAFIIQWIAFIPAYINQTEKFYDLTGSIAYLTVIVAAMFLSAAVTPRSLLLFVLIAIWTVRLGSFLFMRIRRAGEDRRFVELKTSFLRFLLTWTLQGLWVALALAAALAAMTSIRQIEVGAFAIVGLLIWVLGFSIEVIADRQKKAFREDPENAGKFIQSGLWAWSRHPNYFGEIILWIGIAIITLPVLNGWQWVTMISPVFVIFLLTRVSGLPMLEESADARWGGQADYEKYKADTPILIPKPPKISG